MVAPAKVRKRPRQEKPVPSWQARFEEMAPRIERHAKIAFRHLRAEARAEAVQAVLCNVCCALARLAELNKLDLAYFTPLARYGVSQVKDGRMTGGHLNCKDILSPYCHKKKGLTIERLDKFDEEEGAWIEILLEDRHAGPAQTAAARIDVGNWFATMRPRDRKIAGALAVGERTMDVARRFRLSEGRISQKRDEFRAGWRRFQGELPDQQGGATSA
jgi:hypothetical protein